MTKGFHADILVRSSCNTTQMLNLVLQRTILQRPVLQRTAMLGWYRRR
jgi:hypothetical protein